jgi:Flp pilus assembly protein protease CpaA
LVLTFFILIAIIISVIDIKNRVIPDKIILPAFVVLLLMKYAEQSLSVYDLYSILITLLLFLIPLALNMAFGGGDLRFGAFCSLFVGLEGVGYFILLSGLLHLLLLLILQKKSFAFAPAMSLAALGSFTIGVL